MPDTMGSIPQSGGSGSRLGLFVFGGYGIGVPIQGISDPTTIYNLNGALYTLYNIPPNVPGSTAPAPGKTCAQTPGCVPFAYLALAQRSTTQFFQSCNQLGLRLKTFNYDFKPCKWDSKQFCSVPRNQFPGMYEVGVGQDQAVTGYGFHGPVLRIRGFYPLPFYQALHVFGTVDLALSYPKAVNGSETLTTAQYVPAGSQAVITDPDVYIQAIRPPVRSSYSFGVGLDLLEAIKLYSKSKIAMSPISPANQSAAVGSATPIQFAATVTGSTDTAITWAVADANGGKEDVGTIDPTSGKYSPPATSTIKAATQLTVTATAHADTSKSSTITLMLQPKSGT